MAPIYSVEFGRGFCPTANNYEIIGTPEAGHVWIVRDATVFCTGYDFDFALEVAFGWTTDGGDLFWDSLPIFALNAFQTYHWQGRRVIEPGVELGFYNGPASFHYSIGGYDLTIA